MRLLPGRFVPAVAAGTLLLLGLAAPAVAEGKPGLRRIGTVPTFPSGARPLAGLASALPMRITIALRPRDPAALSAYAAAVSDPTSASYHRYLRPDEFARRFAPGAATVRALEAALRTRGLSPGRVSANGLSIRVATTAAGVERAFALSLARVALSGGGDAVLNTSAPALPTGVASAVDAVIGLTSLDRPRPELVRPGTTRQVRAARVGQQRSHVATGGAQPCSAATSAAPGQAAYTADQVASAYRFSPLYQAGDEGQGVTIALYELESDDPADISAYQACYGTDTSVSYVPVDGGAGTGPGSGEAALDIEQLIGLAPKARLLVYQGPNSNDDGPGSGPYDTDSAIVSQDAASIVSTSWGECESLEGTADAQAENVLFEEAAVQGQTFVSAAGDAGSEDCYSSPPGLPDTALGVDDPASQPFVTGVGGTTLSAIGPPPVEMTWNNGGNVGGLLGIEPGAGGGGISSLWDMPAYQSTAPNALNVRQADSSGAPCGSGAGLCRQVPDVSADADPDTGYLIYYNGSGADPEYPSGWQGTGGTSASAPLWAALVALANGEGSCRGQRVGFINPALYRLAGDSQGTYFNDITTGNNDFTGTGGGRYPAGGGYDMATGLGSPNAAALAPALCGEGLRIADIGNRRTFAGTKVSLRVSATDATGAGVRFAGRGLPAGLSLNSSTGLISGRTRAAGTSEVTIDAVDAAGALQGTSFVWTIDGRPTAAAGALTQVRTRAPRLTLTVQAGRLEPSLRTLTVRLPAGLRWGALRELTVTVRGRRAAHTSKVSRGVLSVRLRSAAPAVRLSFGRGALVAGGSLPAEAARRARVAVRVGITDADGQTTALTTRPRLRLRS
jgi:subtilase family serine protease